MTKFLTLIFFVNFSMSLVMSCDSEKPGATMPSDDGVNGAFALVNRLQLYHEIHGTGQPLVLIHGGGSTIQTTFGRILPSLVKRHKVIAVELQAHGHTKDRDSPESFEQDADDVAGLLGHLGIARADFLGFSNGGNTAMQIAIRHPRLVNKLVVASAFYKRDGMQKGFFDAMNSVTLHDMPAYLEEAYLEIPGNDSAGLQRMFDRDADRMRTFQDWPEVWLESIQAPSLILLGDNDVITREHALQMSRKIPNSSLMIIPGGHGSYIGEGLSASDPRKTPELVVELIENFLN